MAAGAAKALSKIISDPLSVFDNIMYGQYSNIPEPKGYWDKISKIFNSYKPRHEDPNFYPNDVLPGMHDVMDGLYNTVAPSQKQLLAGEPDLKFLNREMLNSHFTDQRRQLKEGINPNDVLSGADLNAFYNEIYKPGVDPKQALQNLAEKLFIERGVDKGAEKSASDETGKLTSLKQKTVKGKDPHKLTQRLAKIYMPDDATFVDTGTGVETPVTQEDLIAAGIIPPVKKKATTGGMYGNNSLPKGGFLLPKGGFGKKQ